MTEATPVNFEDRIMQAVVAQFFAPQWAMMPVYDPGTGQTMSQMIQQQSPAARVANDIYAAKQGEITAAVKERLDVNEIAEAVATKITNDIVTRLTTQSSLWSSYDKDQAAMRKLVNERIADELARRAIAKLDEEVADVQPAAQ